MRREVLGENSPDVARTLNNMGMVYNAAGEPEKAETSLREALDRAGDRFDVVGRGATATADHVDESGLGELTHELRRLGR